MGIAGLTLAGILLAAGPVSGAGTTHALTVKRAGGGAVAAAPAEEYVLRAEPVYFNANLLAANTPIQTGDTVLFDGPGGTTCTVTVRQVGCDRNGILTLIGRLPGHEMDTFVLSAKEGRVLATLQDLGRQRLYRVRYEEKQKANYTVEYDVKNMPPAYDRERLAPK